MTDHSDMYKSESKHLKSEDIGNREYTLKIVSSKVEDMDKNGTDRKLVIYFDGREKGMALNKTNFNVLANNFGKDSDGWTGKEIIIFTIDTEYQGQPTKGLRLRMVPDNSFPDDDPGF